MINIITSPGIAPEKDELYSSELDNLYNLQKRQKAESRKTEDEIKKLHRLNAESRGLEPAYIGRDDLKKIIEDLLANTSTVSKAFARHEVKGNKCAAWAKRIIKYSVDRTELSSALDELANNTGLILMKKYKVLDVKDILRSVSYSAALTKIKKQLDIANTIQDKDNQLASNKKTIAARDAKIEELNEELLRDKSNDWEARAVELQHDGVSVTKIALRVGKSRGSVSTYLNSPKRWQITPTGSI